MPTESDDGLPLTTRERRRALLVLGAFSAIELAGIIVAVSACEREKSIKRSMLWPRLRLVTDAREVKPC